MAQLRATKITSRELEKIQIDHGLVYLDYGTAHQRYLAPTRGGGEFKASVEMRDIEFDGRVAKTAGAQVVDGNSASLKVTLLGITQENLKLALPGGITAALDGEAEAVTHPDVGVIAAKNYLKNITCFAKTLDGKYKKIVINNPMSEGELGITMQQKAEAELEITFEAHDTIEELGSKLWKVTDAETIEEAPAQQA